MDDIINQAISEAATVDSTAPIETPETEATEETAPTEAIEPVDVPFPKKAVNALSRRDKQIGKLQANNAALERELSKYREQQTSAAQKPPSEESFDNYGEYLKAQARMEFEQEQSQKTKQEAEQRTTAEQEAWYSERTEQIKKQVDERVASIPDYRQLLMEHADIVQSLPDHIEKAFYESDAPELAFYALAKEGKLESLFNMSPARAAIEIGKAEVRGETLSKAKQITKTPPPIEGVKGTGSSSKTLETMNSQELLKWVNTK